MARGPIQFGIARYTKIDFGTRSATPFDCFQSS